MGKNSMKGWAKRDVELAKRGLAQFTLLSYDGSYRMEMLIKRDSRPHPRGSAMAGFVYEVQTEDGRKLHAKVVACSLRTCFCDAQLTDEPLSDPEDFE